MRVGAAPLCSIARDAVVEKLDQVPAFAICNAAEELVTNVDKESGERVNSFFLDISEAQKALANLEALNPGVDIQLTVAPLGTVFALSEWQEDGQASSAVNARLLAGAEEVELVRSMLAENAKSPPQVQERNARDGPIPLFGADAIKFQLPEEEGGEMTPLFFRRADMRNAWLASGQDAASMPDAYVTDLRTLCHQMENDDSRDWQPVLLVAPEDGIQFVQEQQRRQQAAATAPAPPKLDLSAADVQSLIFGQDDVPFR